MAVQCKKPGLRSRRHDRASRINPAMNPVPLARLRRVRRITPTLQCGIMRSRRRPRVAFAGVVVVPFQTESSLE
jgi:hypothetical protein